MTYKLVLYLTSIAITLQHVLSESPPGAQSSGLLQSNLTAEARRYSTPSDSQPTGQGNDKEDVKIFVGIFAHVGHQIGTSPSGGLSEGAIDATSYAARRDVLRATTLAAMNRPGSPVLARFVVGKPAENESDTAAWQALRREMDRYNDFMEIPVLQLDHKKAEKAMLFFAQVVQQYPSVEYVVKAEDGSFIQAERLLMAADQWAAMRADYIGCMGFSRVATNDRTGQSHEYAYLLSAEYPMRAINPTYVLSRRAADSVARNSGRLRLLGSSDDASVALWMLRITVKYFDDQRLCAPFCQNNTVALARWPEGLSATRIAEAAANMECAASVPWPLPYTARGEWTLLKQRVRAA